MIDFVEIQSSREKVWAFFVNVMEEENRLVTQGREIKDGGTAGSNNGFPSGGAATLLVVGLISWAPTRAAAWLMVLGSFLQVNPPQKELGQCHLHILRKRNIIVFIYFKKINSNSISVGYPSFFFNRILYFTLSYSKYFVFQICLSLPPNYKTFIKL